MVSILPHNLQTKVCDPVVATAMEWVDWCAAAESHDCVINQEQEQEVGTLTWETARLQEPLSSIIANQEIIYKYIQESVENLNKSISELQYASTLKNSQENLVDEKELQRQQLQAQIEALQNEMNNL